MILGHRFPDVLCFLDCLVLFDGDNFTFLLILINSVIYSVDCYFTALHVAVQCGHVEAVRVLLTESSINAEAFNAR